MQITVESAIPLEDAQKLALANRLETLLREKDLSMTYRSDSNLIGGLRILTPEKVIDLSIAAQLTQLNQRLQTKLG